MLEELDPRAFEEWCKVLLERHYQCKVEITAYVGDEGRDLIVHHPEGKIIVECKHYLNSSVGRPIVQKLDSAIRTADARKGMILTTGKVSKEAEDYAKKIKGVGIEFIDGVKLAHIASKVGLLSSNSSIDSYANLAIKTVADSDFPRILFSSIFTKQRYNAGHDKNPAITIIRKTEYNGYYIGDFSAHGKVDTARGIKRAFWEDKIWSTLDGKRFGVGQPPNFNPYGDLILIGEALIRTAGIAPPPSIQPHKASSEMKRFLLDSQSKTITYVGRNNVRYYKQIKPNASSTQIDDVRLIYIPKQRFEIRVDSVTHIGEIAELGEKFVVKSYSLSECCVCGRSTTSHSQTFCTICHKPAHTSTFLTPDSFRCAKCKSTICRKHAVKRGKYILCKQCSPNKGNSLGARWLPHFLIGVGASSILLAFILLLFIASNVIEPTSGTQQLRSALGISLLIGIAITIVTWLPFLYVATSWIFRIKHDTLTYQIIDATH